MKEKKLTEKDCYKELERCARIVCERKVDADDIKFIRQTFKCCLEQLAKIEDAKRRRAEERKRIAEARKLGIRV